MPEDVQMSEPLPAAPPAATTAAPAPSTLHNLKEIASVIEAGALSKEVRRISRAVRLTVALRSRLAASDVSAFLAFALPASSDAYVRLTSLLPKEDDTEMDVDATAAATQISIKQGLPEIEIYCSLLVLIFLIDQKKYDEAKSCATASIARLKTLNRRTVDVLASRLYFYYSHVHELTNSLAEIRGMAILHRDELGQAPRRAPASGDSEDPSPAASNGRSTSTEESQWLATLSEPELDFLISLKVLAVKRAETAGRPHLANVFDLRTLRALGIVLLESFKERLKETSVDPAILDNLALSRDSDVNVSDSGSDSVVFRKKRKQMHNG